MAPPFSGVVVGEVLESGRHPDAEKLSLCQVTTDGVNRLQIVCGAERARGLKVAVAMVGAQLPGDVTIKRAKLRGLESNGMLCSARELGLGEEHDGIMELPDSLPLNQDLRAALDLDDVMLEVNATPNRGDCMSVFGIARDYAAAQERRYLTARVRPVAARGTRGVSGAPRSVGGLPGVRIARDSRRARPDAASPAWLRERLRRVGINSISPIVDVTNYVMMDLGQPMHAYDLAKLDEGIRVRLAKPRERITLLDDKEYELDPEFLVIADARGAIGLAGIMGGPAHGDFRFDHAMCCWSRRTSRRMRLRGARGGSGSSPMRRSGSSAASIRRCRRLPSSGRRRCCWRSPAASPDRCR